MSPTFKITLCISLALWFLESSAQIQFSKTISSESEVDISTYSGIISEQYANGTPSLWRIMENGKTEGKWMEWYPSGVLRYRAFWKNGLGHGRWEYYYPNGQLRSEAFYINDIAQGLFKSYHENGQLHIETTYLNGNKIGPEITYDANGILSSRKFYENGVRTIDEPTLFLKGIVSGESSNEWHITFTPDGQTTYFSRRDMRTGRKRIYISTKSENGWSKAEIASFSTAEDEAPFVTRDGKSLFFASYRPLPHGKSSQEMDMNIWVMEMNEDSWSEPKPLSSIINGSMKEGNIWPENYEAGPFSDEKGNLYFWTKGSKNNGTNIYSSARKKNGEYGNTHELLPPSIHSNYDTSPHLSPDGNILFFSSDDRDDGYGAGDIYYSIKKDEQWSEAKNLGPTVNSYQSEGAPSFSPDGKYFYFSSDRGDSRDSDGNRISNIYYMETRFLTILK